MLTSVDIAVDWISDKIYWTNSNRIVVYDLQRGYQTTLYTSPGLFHQVEADPNARYVASIFYQLPRFNYNIIGI